MSVQHSTSAPISELLNGFFDSLGSLNEALANRINTYFRANTPEEKVTSHTNMVQTIDELVHVLFIVIYFIQFIDFFFFKKKGCK